MPLPRAIDAGPFPGGELTQADFFRIHDRTLEVLSTSGMWFGSEAALARFRERGFKTDGRIVFFEAADIESALDTTANRFTLLARNPAHSIDFHPDATVVGMGRSAAFVMDGNRRRRSATCDDFIELTKLAQSLPAVQMLGNLVTPGDIPPAAVAAFMGVSQLRYSDKPCIFLDEGDLDLLCIAFGITRDRIKADAERGLAYGQATVNPLSPLAVSSEQADFLIVAAEYGMPISISPTPATGSTGPCTLAGTLLLNNCEVLALLVLTQIVRPGLPVLYGTFPSGVDMRTMIGTYGSPEARLMESAAARIAKHYGLLTRGNVGATDALSCDFQSGAESMFNFATAMASRINHLPGCGHLGSFAAASREKMVLDAEAAAYARRWMRPIDFSDEALAADLIQQVGPRSNYLTSTHTFAHFRSELHHPELFSRATYVKWAEDARDLAARAEAKADALLAAYVRPEMDPEIDAALARFLTPVFPPKPARSHDFARRMRRRRRPSWRGRSGPIAPGVVNLFEDAGTAHYGGKRQPRSGRLFRHADHEKSADGHGADDPGKDRRDGRRQMIGEEVVPEKDQVEIPRRGRI
jgi:trimethylamine--corrinoid protein Co-methyltransferase